MALIPAGYCCKVRYVARCLASVQLLLAFVRVKKGAANLMGSGCERG